MRTASTMMGINSSVSVCSSKRPQVVPMYYIMVGPGSVQIVMTAVINMGQKSVGNMSFCLKN
jgi:hypothetical protein